MPKTVILTDHWHPSLGPCGGTAAGLAVPVPVTRTSEALPGSESAVDSVSECPQAAAALNRRPSRNLKLYY